ncbi:hypothetical protein HOY80DRAFT_963585 [Tuber brumale]|nr:hypothetical protein HOY80DRAFT_963585 [Tuber brumale]
MTFFCTVMARTLRNARTCAFRLSMSLLPTVKACSKVGRLIRALPREVTFFFTVTTRALGGSRVRTIRLVMALLSTIEASSKVSGLVRTILREMTLLRADAAFHINCRATINLSTGTVMVITLIATTTAKNLVNWSTNSCIPRCPSTCHDRRSSLSTPSIIDATRSRNGVTPARHV